MASGDTFFLTSNTQAMAQVFTQYARLNLQDVTELALKKGRSLSISLFMLTPVVNMSDIKQKLAELGWRVQRKFSGRAHKGETNEHALKRMHDSIATARFNHRQYMASGWLPAVYRFKGDVKVLRAVKNPRGRVEMELHGDRPFIAIINSTNGIASLEKKRPFIDKAIQREIDDMLVYIERKQRERATIFNPSGRA